MFCESAKVSPTFPHVRTSCTGQGLVVERSPQASRPQPFSSFPSLFNFSLLEGSNSSSARRASVETRELHSLVHLFANSIESSRTYMCTWHAYAARRTVKLTDERQIEAKGSTREYAQRWQGAGVPTLPAGNFKDSHSRTHKNAHSITPAPININV